MWNTVNSNLVCEAQIGDHGMKIIYQTSEYIVIIHIQLNFCVEDNMYFMSSTNTSYMDSCLM